MRKITEIPFLSPFSPLEKAAMGKKWGAGCASDALGDRRWERDSRGRGHTCTCDLFMLIYGRNQHNSVKQFSSVQLLSRVWLFATPWIAARQDSLSITNSQGLLKLTSINSVMPSSHLILFHPLLLLPPIPPSIRVFSSDSALHMRWPKFGVSASTSVFPMNIQDWFPLGWTGWISYINIISTYKLNVAWKPKSSHWKCLCEYINSIILQVWSQPFYQFLITLHMQASVHQWECSLNHYN